MNKVKWTASLSDGQTVYEEKGDYHVTTGAPSPYQRLLAYCEENDVTITSLSLYMDNGLRINLPSVRMPQFQSLQTRKQPVSYRFFRKMEMNKRVSTGEVTQKVYAVIRATFDDCALELWADERGNSWAYVL